MIRKACINDVPRLSYLLEEINKIHHDGRPDLFKLNTKYNYDELSEIINDSNRPIFVFEKDGLVIGYVFCIITQKDNDNILRNIKTLYIDDFCVDKDFRKNGIGKELYNHVVKYAKEIDCYNITLNVWCLNDEAIKFYEKCGLIPYKIGMEKIL